MGHRLIHEDDVDGGVVFLELLDGVFAVVGGLDFVFEGGEHLLAELLVDLMRGVLARRDDVAWQEVYVTGLSSTRSTTRPLASGSSGASGVPSPAMMSTFGVNLTVLATLALRGSVAVAIRFWKQCQTRGFWSGTKFDADAISGSRCKVTCVS